MTATKTEVKNSAEATTGQLATFEKCKNDKGERILTAEVKAWVLVVHYRTKSGHYVAALADTSGKVYKKSFYRFWNEDNCTPFELITETHF